MDHCRTRSLVLALALGTLSSACASPRDVADSASSDSAGHDSAASDSTLHAQHGSAQHGAAPGDSAFAKLQNRGAVGMGVDQYTSTHTFESRPDGGRITLRRDVDDSAGVETIRAHMRSIGESFATGNFDIPGFVHAERVPGTDVMAARRDAITYRANAIPRGGELVITTRDSAALAAVHRFLEYQRREHRASGSPP